KLIARCGVNVKRGQVSNGHAGNGGCGRMGNGNGCANNSCGHAGNGRGCDNSENGAHRGWGLHDHPLAMVYSPYQHFRNTYTPDIALGRGTLFSELDLPFEGYHNKRNGGCAR
ncbi:MAG: spore coat associated protein CotJA, partial [Clostridia bacterium]|nr:spore coat associated protein CotJA [Clostridia bacterium]